MTDLVLPYPDFVNGTTIVSQQVDDNNAAITTHINTTGVQKYQSQSVPPGALDLPGIASLSFGSQTLTTSFVQITTTPVVVVQGDSSIVTASAVTSKHTAVAGGLFWMSTTIGAVASGANADIQVRCIKDSTASGGGTSSIGFVYRADSITSGAGDARAGGWPITLVAGDVLYLEGKNVTGASAVTVATNGFSLTYLGPST